MVRENEIRDGEVAVTPPAPSDAGLVFIGRIHTPWTSRMQAPRQGRADGPLCRVEVFEPWVAALDGLENYPRIEVLYWLDKSRRDLVRQSPRNDGATRGTFSLRSPARPNPIGTSIAELVRIEGATVLCAGWTAWMGHRCWTSSRIAPASRRLRRHRPGISRSGRMSKANPHGCTRRYRDTRDARLHRRGILLDRCPAPARMARLREGAARTSETQQMAAIIA
jgi:tRNA-Thr(GGU) m(6)t(6)A37 methyltransferase TsaA